VKVGPLFALLLQSCAVVACARIDDSPAPVTDATTGDVTAEDGPYEGDAWWARWDAAVFDVPPAVGMYPPNGAGPCDVTGCATSSSLCIPGQGWCCEGTIESRAPYRCVCGAGLGCLPPQVCCGKGVTVARCTSNEDCR
jgi:hypothetical protein